MDRTTIVSVIQGIVGNSINALDAKKREKQRRIDDLGTINRSDIEEFKSKVELLRERDGLTGEIQHKQVCLGMLQILSSQERVGSGSVVIFDKQILIVMPKFLGCSCSLPECDGRKMFCVSLQKSPIAQRLLGKKTGDTVEFANSTYEITVL